MRITTRDASSAKALALADKGAQLFAFNDPLANVVAGADVVVNVLPSAAWMEINKQLVGAMLQAGVKVYFPSEFGA